MRELEPMSMEERELKGEMEIRERIVRLLSPLKAPDSIETRLLERKVQNDGKE